MSGQTDRPIDKNKKKVQSCKKIIGSVDSICTCKGSTHTQYMILQKILSTIPFHLPTTAVTLWCTNYTIDVSSASVPNFVFKPHHYKAAWDNYY